MQYNIPQFIDKEDKIVGPLTAKQLGWLFSGGVVLLVLWSMLDSQTFYISALPIIGISVAFAFYRPYNQSLLTFILSAILFTSRDKTYVWKRIEEKNIPIKKVSQKKEIGEVKKIDSEKIRSISNLLDNRKK